MTREEALEYNKNLREYMRITDKKSEYKFLKENYEALEMAIQALEQEPKWIPVTEKLPEESTAVLVWCPERKNIYCAYYEEKCWWIFGACFAKLTKVTSKVIAWMSLPQPYKAESEDK